MYRCKNRTTAENKIKTVRQYVGWNVHLQYATLTTYQVIWILFLADGQTGTTKTARCSNTLHRTNGKWMRQTTGNVLRTPKMMGLQFCSSYSPVVHPCYGDLFYKRVYQMGQSFVGTWEAVCCLECGSSEYKMAFFFSVAHETQHKHNLNKNIKILTVWVRTCNADNRLKYTQQPMTAHAFICLYMHKGTYAVLRENENNRPKEE
jgi:hypothetical protein